ncbi:hypothetical protein [Armatimonas rosea]|uniref:Uncharacterized protein n=1 Tax=Armatimonas rosea TaxID=685828 RepID=A0A7W9STW4_ARMRO|nr:hypothetical protein [Armatimonas rosea]MBB6052253.1 hypothetical protein [Armatimonas rosea]
MGHSISGLLLKGPYEPVRAAQLGMPSRSLPFDLTLFFCEWRLAEYWSRILGISGELPIPDSIAPPYPRDQVLITLMQTITQQPEPLFAILATDYFGGIGSQAAFVFQGERRVTPEGEDSINAALVRLGVISVPGHDAFETLGLDKIRSMPDIDLPEYDVPTPTTYPHPIPGLLPRTENAFWLAAGISELSLRRLVDELPPDHSLTFYDPTYPSPTDPGAFVTVTHGPVGGFLCRRANHGWHTRAEPIRKDEALALLVAASPHHVPLNATAATVHVRPRR